MLTIFLISLLVALGLFFFYLFFFKKPKFHPLKFFLGLWFCAIGVSQLGLSDIEKPWSLSFWAIILSSLACFTIGSYIVDFLVKKRKKDTKVSLETRTKMWHVRLKWILILMVAASVLANIYIYIKIGTLPLFSSDPDHLRLITNKEIFGIFEYLALLPRLYIPLSFLFIFMPCQRRVRCDYWMVGLFVALGLGTLLLYVSRVTVFFAIIVSYFAYLILNVNRINWRKIIVAATCLALILLGGFMISIPLIRQSITYKEIYQEKARALEKPEEALSSTAYVYDISKMKIPKKFSFLAIPYTSISFNFQTLQNSIQYYSQKNTRFLGKVTFKFLCPLLRLAKIEFLCVDIPWEEIFLPWWVTGTYLFGYFADFGLIGLIIATLIWGAISSLLYYRTRSKSSITNILLFSVLCFVLLMSLYTNYMGRPEIYMDIAAILAIGYIINIKRKF